MYISYEPSYCVIRGEIDKQFRRMVFLEVVGMMVLLSIDTVASASTNKREVSVHNKRLADIREGVALLGNVANGSRVGMI